MPKSTPILTDFNKPVQSEFVTDDDLIRIRGIIADRTTLINMKERAFANTLRSALKSKRYEVNANIDEEIERTLFSSSTDSEKVVICSQLLSSLAKATKNCLSERNYISLIEMYLRRKNLAVSEVLLEQTERYRIKVPKAILDMVVNISSDLFYGNRKSKQPVAKLTSSEKDEAKSLIAQSVERMKLNEIKEFKAK